MLIDTRKCGKCAARTSFKKDVGSTWVFQLAPFQYKCVIGVIERKKKLRLIESSFLQNVLDKKQILWDATRWTNRMSGV
jgi:hypothetical protein